jgi:hypothetical protein
VCISEQSAIMFLYGSKLLGFVTGQRFFFYCAVEVKVKFNLEQSMKAQRESRCVALAARYERNL